MTGSTAHPAPLSQQLVDEGASRFTGFAAVLAVGVVMFHVVQRIAQPQLAPLIDDPVNRLAALLAVLMAGGLVALQRFNAVTSTTLLQLGMAFEIAVAHRVIKRLPFPLAFFDVIAGSSRGL